MYYLNECRYIKYISIQTNTIIHVTKEQMKAVGYEQNLKFIENSMERLFGSFESLIVGDTYQFNDYPKYVATAFDEKKKAQVREDQFPTDCKNAFDMGVNFVKQSISRIKKRRLKLWFLMHQTFLVN